MERYFFTPLHFPRSWISVVGWWESRRAVYNVVVGTSGLVSLGSMFLFGILPPRIIPDNVEWLAVAGGVVGYGILANLCYALGPIADILLRRFFGERAAAAGPALLRYGTAFSVGLTLLPIPLSILGWLLRAAF